jgi:hypothetical protein
MATHASDEGVVIGTLDGRRALLADFDIDQHDLRPKHREWLNGLANIVRRSHLRPPHGIWLIETTGRASKTGSNAHNAKLSDRRKTEVRLYLERRIGPVPVQWIEKVLGEEAPFDAAIDENARDRSVEVFARPSVFIEPPPPKRDPRPPAADKIFDLVVNNFVCIVGEGTFIRFTTWIMNITISDPITDLAAQYSFEGSGTSAPVPTKGIVTSVQIRSVKGGSVQSFRASNRLTVDSFAGDGGLSIPVSGPNQFRFGGNKITDNTGPRKFPRGTVNGFALPNADRGLPAFASATGKFSRGVADVWF